MMTSLLNIDEGTATLLAAIIAAIFSFFTLLSIKPKEIRTANRKTLEPYIYDLSDSIHQLIAISRLIILNSQENVKVKIRALDDSTSHNIHYSQY